MPTFPSTSPTGSFYSAPSINYGPLPTDIAPGAAGSTTSTANLINSLNRSGQAAALGARIPNAGGLEAQSSANIGNELAGQLPPDVRALLGQQAAENATASGVSGSPAANSAYLRALGLTSLQEQQMGQQNLSAALARNPQAPLYDPSQMVLSPYQSAELTLQEANALTNTRLAQLPQGGGGGGGRTSGYNPPTLPSPIQPQSVGATGIIDSGYIPHGGWSPTASYPDQVRAWQDSIGYGQGAPTTTGPGVTTINGQPIDYSGGGVPGTITINGQQIDATTGQPLSNMNLDQLSGLDSSLYGNVPVPEALPSS